MAKVLVIDDDPAVRTTISIVLKRAGHEVTGASDGRSGMKAVMAGGIDLLIADIFMPVMDGLEMIKEVRRHQPGLPVIVISGASIFGSSTAPPDFVAMAVSLGAVRGLRKPFAPGELLAAVNECLGERDRIASSQ